MTVLGWGKKEKTKQEDQDEMSMEEILASIRRYVSDDQKVREPEPQKQEPRSTPKTNSPYAEYPAPAPAAEHVHYMASSPIDTGYDPQAHKLSYPVETPKHAHQEHEHSPYHREPVNEQLSYTALLAEEKVIERAVEHAVEKVMYEAAPERGASQETVSASAAALHRLIEANRANMERDHHHAAGVVTVEKLMADLARPMIREWIENNLTRVVESMVAHEIEKITKHLRS